MDLLDKSYLGNSVTAYLHALLTAVAVVVIFALVRRLVMSLSRRWAQRKAPDWDGLFVGILAKTKWGLICVVALAFGLATLPTVSRSGHRLLEVVAVVSILVQLGTWSSTAVLLLGERARAQKIAAGDPGRSTGITLLEFLARIVVWVFIVLLILDNLEVDVNTLLAGMGIGGIAVALAVQNILADLFASVSILLDRPFAVGDSIRVGEHEGTVVSVGVKTTRVHAISGEQLVFSNAELLKSRIHNFERLEERRESVKLQVEYDTKPELVREIPKLLRAAVDQEDRVRFGRAHLVELGSSALTYELVFFVVHKEYEEFARAKESILFRILESFAHQNIAFAYPTSKHLVAALASDTLAVTRDLIQPRGD